MFRMGGPELIVIGVLLLLIFGPSQIPRIGRSIGETIKSVRGIGKEIQSSLEDTK